MFCAQTNQLLGYQDAAVNWLLAISSTHQTIGREGMQLPMLFTH
jgi:hypothetical protein